MTAGLLPAPPPQPVDRLGVWLLAALIALSLVGFPLSALVASALGLEGSAISIAMRVLVLLVAGATLAHFATRRHRFRLDVLVLLFFWLYSVRLVWDLNEPTFEDLPAAILFFVATVVLPALAAMIGARGYDERLTAEIVFVAGALLCGGALTLDRLGLGAYAELSEATGRLWLGTLNPISLGHVATTTIIAALAIWRSPRIRGGRLALAGGVLVALSCLVLAASRGPILALIVVGISYAVLQGRWGRILAGGLSLLIVGPVILASQGIKIIERFTDISNDISAIERVTTQSRAMVQAMDSPLFGSAYVELVSGDYPHNLFIDAFMALGIGGLVLFTVICARSGAQAVVRLRAGQIFLPLLLVQYFIAGMFSGSFWGASALFLVVVLLSASASNPNTGRKELARQP